MFVSSSSHTASRFTIEEGKEGEETERGRGGDREGKGRRQREEGEETERERGGGRGGGREETESGREGDRERKEKKGKGEG